jgi:hypothetical protein
MYFPMARATRSQFTLLLLTNMEMCLHRVILSWWISNPHEPNREARCNGGPLWLLRYHLFCLLFSVRFVENTYPSGFLKHLLGIILPEFGPQIQCIVEEAGVSKVQIHSRRASIVNNCFLTFL